MIDGGAALSPVSRENRRRLGGASAVGMARQRSLKHRAGVALNARCWRATSQRVSAYVAEMANNRKRGVIGGENGSAAASANGENRLSAWQQLKASSW
jgi:hypothetical protein